MCTWGWCVIAEPQVCSTAVMPILASRCLGSAGDRDRGLGRSLEQEIVDHGLVLVRDVRDRAGQRVDDVEVWRREQLGFPLFQPLPRRRALALRAMPVATAVVRDDRVGAALAARDMAAERNCAAALDRTHHLHLVEAACPALARRHPPRGRGRYPRPLKLDGAWPQAAQASCGALPLFLGVLRGSHSKSSGLSMAEIMPVATRV